MGLPIIGGIYYTQYENGVDIGERPETFVFCKAGVILMIDKGTAYYLIAEENRFVHNICKTYYGENISSESVAMDHKTRSYFIRSAGLLLHHDFRVTSQCENHTK